MSTVITPVSMNTNVVMCINHSYTYYCVLSVTGLPNSIFPIICWNPCIMVSLFVECDKTITPWTMRVSCVIAFWFTAKHMNSNVGGTVKLEALYLLKHWHSPIGLNGVKSRKTTLCGKTCVHINVFPAPVLSNSHFNIHRVLKNIIMLLQCCVRNEHVQTRWVFLLCTLHKTLH